MNAAQRIGSRSRYTFHVSRSIIIALLVLLICAAEGRAEEAAPSGAEKSNAVLLMPRNDIPGVKNFAKVSDVLYRGEQPSAEGFAELKKMGVKTIVNLRAFHSDRDALTGTGLQYFHINCKAWHPEAEDVALFLKLLSDPNNQPVFVHCQHGADRTGMMVASYRILEQHWTIADAAQETHNFGFHTVFTEIQNFLKQFDAPAMRKRISAAAAPKVEVVK